MTWIEPALKPSELDDTPVTYRIPGLLTMNGNVLLSAYRKTGKTTLVLHLAAALTDKKKTFLGRPCTALDGRLVYVNFELEQNMLRKYIAEQQIDLDSDNLLIQDYRGKATKFQLADKEWRSDYADFLAEERTAAIIVDPIHVVTVATSTDSNSNDESRAVMELLGEIADMAGLDHLLVVDHTGHADKSRARGASGKEDWADVLWNLQRSEGQENATLNVTGRGANGQASYTIDGDGQLAAAEPGGGDNPKNRVRIALGTSNRPLTVKELQALTNLGQPRVSEALNELEMEGNVRRAPWKQGRAEMWVADGC